MNVLRVVISPYHTVIPVNCRKITSNDFTGKYKNVLFTQATTFHLFTGKAPFTHQFQNTSKFWIRNYLLTAAAPGVVFVNMEGYTWSVFLFMFHFVSNVYIHAAAFAQRHRISLTSNWTTQCRINASSANLNFNGSGLARVDVLRQWVLKLNVLIPVISFCVHTEEITGNVLVMLQLLIK